MCIFSQSIEQVSRTRIYARRNSQRQCLVYEMHLVSTQDQAMVLPLPIAAGDLDAVEFVDLSAHATFFDLLDHCFPMPVNRGPVPASAGSTLAVHRVGAFEASFVPSRADFARLDPRFRLDDAVWDRFPGYQGFGFAVFQLHAGDARVHPMALWFRSRDPNRLFFPTTHVHDGEVHATADYDHRLYAQGGIEAADWLRGGILPNEAFDPELLESPAAHGLIDLSQPLLRRTLRGERPNADVWIDTL
ncbi:MAG: hypothetical protein ACREP7_18160 [Lysobacter sp.]